MGGEGGGKRVQGEGLTDCINIDIDCGAYVLAFHCLTIIQKIRPNKKKNECITLSNFPGDI